MELTGELKNQVEKTATKEEAKEVIAKAGMLLSDEELEQVSGGMQPPSGLANVQHLANQQDLANQQGLVRTPEIGNRDLR